MTDQHIAAAALTRVATHIAETLGAGDIVYVAADERDAEAIAAAVTAITAGTVVHVPSSDTLPGDDAPASPANAGQRASALRRLRIAAGEADRPPIACIVSAEATARLYP